MLSSAGKTECSLSQEKTGKKLGLILAGDGFVPLCDPEDSRGGEPSLPPFNPLCVYVSE